MRARALWAPLLLIGAVVVVLSACGGDDGADPTARGGTPTAAGSGASLDTPTATTASGDESINACDLLTKDEVASALGSEPDEGTRSDYPPLYSCRFESEGPNQLDVTVLVYPSSDEARGGYEAVLDINDYPEIDGLGDRAYDTRPIGDITAQKGKYEISIDILTEDDETDYQAAIELTRKVLDRLP